MNFHTVHKLLSYHKEYSHKKIREKNLSDTEGMICSYLYSHDGCSQDDVVTALNADKTTIAKAIYSLEEKACLTRTQDRKDHRIKRLSLTEDGRNRIDDIKDIHDEWLREVMSYFSEEEKAEFDRTVSRLLHASEEMMKKRGLSTVIGE